MDAAVLAGAVDISLPLEAVVALVLMVVVPGLLLVAACAVVLRAAAPKRRYDEMRKEAPTPVWLLDRPADGASDAGNDPAAPE